MLSLKILCGFVILTQIQPNAYGKDHHQYLSVSVVWNFAMHLWKTGWRLETISLVEGNTELRTLILQVCTSKYCIKSRNNTQMTSATFPKQ